jgi:stage V sporulation protein AA
MVFLYLKAEQSQCFHKKTITIKDMAKVYCSNPDIKQGVERIPVAVFQHYPNDKVVLSILKIIELIQQQYPDVAVMNLGEKDMILYYKEGQQEKKWVLWLKIILICATAFFGAGFSIMAYNGDISAHELFTKMYYLVMGKMPMGPSVLELSYSIGLAAGVIVFFNHVANKKLSDDPTPFEVQMRLYEDNVNKTFITGAGRKEEEIDADS